MPQGFNVAKRFVLMMWHEHIILCMQNLTGMCQAEMAKDLLHNIKT